MSKVKEDIHTVEKPKRPTKATFMTKSKYQQLPTKAHVAEEDLTIEVVKRGKVKIFYQTLTYG